MLSSKILCYSILGKAACHIITERDRGCISGPGMVTKAHEREEGLQQLVPILSLFSGKLEMLAVVTSLLIRSILASQHIVANSQYF